MVSNGVNLVIMIMSPGHHSACQNCWDQKLEGNQLNTRHVAQYLAIPREECLDHVLLERCHEGGQSRPERCPAAKGLVVDSGGAPIKKET